MGPKYCTCSVIDLLMQADLAYHSSNQVKLSKQIANHFIELFQSYQFKEQLCFSYIANISQFTRHGGRQAGMSSLGVHILSMTSVTSRIVKDAKLCKELTNTLHTQIHEFVTNPDEGERSKRLTDFLHLIHDIKYIAKPELLPEIISNTTIVEDMLAAIKEFHFADTCARPLQMALYEDQELNKKLIDCFRAVLTAGPIAIKYLRRASASSVPDIRRIIQNFATLFAGIEQDYSNNHVGKGFLYIPVHQLFSTFITRLLVRHYFDSNTSTTFNKYLTDNFISDLELSSLYNGVLLTAAV